MSDLDLAPTILLLGGEGQLGREFVRLLAAEPGLHVTSRAANIPGCQHHSLDLANGKALEALLARLQPGLIINAAAYTAVDKAESEPQLADAVNAQVPALLAQYAMANQARLLHFSTDYVFSGEAIGRGWREDDPVAPLGQYGASKLAGEQAVIDSGCDHLIMRTAWVYGLHGHNFLRSMLRLGRERDALSIVDDQIGTPTWARDLAQTAWLAACHGLEGVFHLSSNGQTSWHGFAQEIFQQAEEFGLLKAPQLTAISSAEYPTPAQRPAWSVLDCRALEQTMIVRLPQWQHSLRRCMEDLAGLGDWVARPNL